MRLNAAFPESVGLRQALLLFGLGLRPQERRLEMIDKYPEQVTDVAALTDQNEGQRAAIEFAKAELARAMIEGQLRAWGRPMICEADMVFEARDGRPIVVDPESERRPREEIPSASWTPRGIYWDSDKLGPVTWPEPGEIAGYSDVSLCTRHVQRLRQLRSKSGPCRTRRRGAARSRGTMSWSSTGFLPWSLPRTDCPKLRRHWSSACRRSSRCSGAWTPRRTRPGSRIASAPCIACRSATTPLVASSWTRTDTLTRSPATAGLVGWQRGN